MAIDTDADFPDLREEVSRLGRTGKSLDEIDAFLGEHELDPEVHSALWLLAWSLQEPQRQRYEARKMLGILEARKRDGLPVAHD